MKKRFTLTLMALLAASLPVSEQAWAQKNGANGSRNNERGNSGQRDNAGRNNSQRNDNQADRGNNGAAQRRSSQQPAGRTNDPGQAIENRIRREVRDLIGTPNRPDQRRDTDQRRDNASSRDGRRDTASGRTDHDHDRDRDRDQGRDRDYDRDRDRDRDYDRDRDHDRNQPGNRYSDRSGYRGQLGRYRYSPLASAIIRQFPSASRILAPRGLRDRGAFYRNDGHYYYYPRQPIVGSGIRQAGNVYVDGGGTVPAPYDNSGYGTPVRVEFGAFVYAAELSNALPSIVNELCLDMHYNYRDADNFNEAYRNAYLILLTAKEIQAAQATNDRASLLAKLAIADELLHVVDEQTHSWVRRETRQIGELGMKTKLEITSDLLHHLMYDVGMPIAGHPQAGSQHEFQQ